MLVLFPPAGADLQMGTMLMVDAPLTRSREISDVVLLRHPAPLFDGAAPEMLATS